MRSSFAREFILVIMLERINTIVKHFVQFIFALRLSAYYYQGIGTALPNGFLDKWFTITPKKLLEASTRLNSM